MLYHLLIAVAGVVGLFSIWIGVQALVRRGSAEFASDSDVLSCRTCGTPDGCRSCVHDPDLDHGADVRMPLSHTDHGADVRMHN